MLRKFWCWSLALCTLFGAQAVATAQEAPPEEPGFKQLFDGKTLNGWEGNTDFWKVDNGCIVGETTAEKPTKGNTFLIWRQGEVDDFELRLQYKIVSEKGNSGIQYRSKDLGNFVVGGYQGDFEAGDMYSGINYEEKGRGILALRGEKVTLVKDPADEKKHKKNVTDKIGDAKELGAKVKKQDWNDYTIIASGNKLQHFINGQLMSEVTDEHEAKRVMSGILALQLHAGPPMRVEFKNIRIKRTKLASVNGVGDRRKIVFVAGRPSHGPGDHEFNAGSLLLKTCLDQACPNVVSTVYKGGWPEDPSAYDNADTIMLYMDGGSGHPVIQRNRLAEIEAHMQRGVGLICAHYAVEVPKEKGGPDFLNWIGGYFEMNWSVNPHWVAEILPLPKHPITNGVQPFKINDEWYFHMRFREMMQGVTPVLSAIAPDSTMSRKDGPHSGNPAVREAVAKKEPQHLAWAYERANGGRGFGYTGGHYHKSWADENNRKLFLNALLWVSKLEVPTNGVVTTLTAEQFEENLDPKGKKK